MAGESAYCEIAREYLDAAKNTLLVQKLFGSYYRSSQHTGKMYEELPDFFLVSPAALGDTSFAERPSDRLILEDCMQRATSRGGHVGVVKHYNPKLKYYWLDLVPMPFLLGDPVTGDTEAQFFHVLNRFIEYARQNPKVYGNLTAEIDADQDLALMLREIGKLGEGLRPMLEFYREDQLVSYKPNWPPTEVKKLLDALRGNEQSWCEVFYEYLIYVMGQKG